MCVVREQQFIIANLILQLGIHDISGPYRLLMSVDVRYLIMDDSKPPILHNI